MDRMKVTFGAPLNRSMLLFGAIISMAALPLFIVHLERHPTSEVVSFGLDYDGLTVTPETQKRVGSPLHEKQSPNFETTSSTRTHSSPPADGVKAYVSNSIPELNIVDISHESRPSALEVAPLAHLLEQSDQASIERQAEKHSTREEPTQDNGSRRVHVIFSTDCSTFQHWQSIVLYYSARAAGQQGPLTRIASGCTAKEQDTLRAMHAELSTQFRVHFTPDFSKDPATGKKYSFYNKPHGLLHWASHAQFNESIVALLDPDMLFLRPITGEFAPGGYITSPDWSKGEYWPQVEKGRPAGQQYGLGAYWRHFKRAYICGGDSPCVTTTAEDAQKHYPVGPPYLLHVDDLKPLAEAWVRFVPKIYEEYPELLAEMYAYCMAAAHLQLRHFKVDHMMVSNVNAGGEGWPWVDEWAQSLEANPNRIAGGPLAAAGSTTLVGLEKTLGLAAADWGGAEVFTGNLPTVVHYCQNYRQGNWLFAKRRVPKGATLSWPPSPDSILHCAHPLLALPPRNLSSVLSYATNDGGTKPLRPREAARVNFVLRTATHGVNAALARFKLDACTGRAAVTDVTDVKEQSAQSHLASSSSRSSESSGSVQHGMNLARSYRLVPEYVERQAQQEAKKKAQLAAKAKSGKGT